MRGTMDVRLTHTARWSVLLAALLLPACSTIQFAYNNVDFVMLDRADHYLDLTAEQRNRAKQLIAARMQVHRREELPLYVATLKEIRAMLADELSEDELDIIKQRIPALYKRTMRDSIPGIVTVLVDLDSAQIEHLEARFVDRNREFADKFMPKSLEVRLDRRVERSTTIFEFFIGPLRPEQVELVKRHRNAMPLTADDWLAYHKARQKEFVALLKRRASRHELERFLIAWWVNLEGQSPALERKMQINTRGWSEMILALDKTVDAGQRQELLDTLDLFIEELGALVPEKSAYRPRPNSRLG